MKAVLLAVAAACILWIDAAASDRLHRRQFRILDLNISGSEALQGQSWLIAWYITAWAQYHGANVITLQEVCATQHNAILAGLRGLNAGWQGTWKSFGPMPGCSNERHGLSVFTLGPHAGLRWWRLDSESTANGYRWWGLMRVHFAGLDVFNTHVRCARVDDHIPKVVAQAMQSPLFLLAGDFNSRPDQPWGQYLSSLWYEIDYDDREYTIGPGRSCPPDGYPLPRKIDYVWTNRLPAAVWGDAVDSPSNHRLLRGVVEHWFLH